MLNNNIFQIQKNKILSENIKDNKIGTLNEKILHKIIKYSLENNENNHEIKVGQYFADILVNDTIYEVQTRSFNKLRKKLDYFLSKYRTYIVFPIIYQKWIYLIDENNKIISKRKSPKTGTIYDSVLELYKIKSYLKENNLNILLVFINVEEYKTLTSQKKISSKINKIPTDFIKEIEINNVNDFKLFLPNNLPFYFTNKDFKNLAKTNIRRATVCTNILSYLGIIKQVGKNGRSILYEIVK